VLVKKKASDFSETQSFVAYFSASSFVLMFVLSFLDSQPFLLRWFPILYILAISILLISEKNLKSISKVHFIFFRLGELLKYIFPLLLIYSASLPGVTGKIVRNRTGLFFTVLIVLLVLYSQRTQIRQGFKISDFSQRFIVIFPVAIVAASLLTTRTSAILLGTIKDSLLVSFPIFVAAFILILNALQYENLIKAVSRQKVVFSSLYIFIFSIWFSFRIDSMNDIPGSYFHVGYYSEVVKTLNSGGTLLWDTPSQYGFLNILYLSVFPFEDSRQSVYIGQSILMLLTVSSVMYLFYTLMRSTRFFLIASSFFLLIFFFADPELIGPQPYPSSSAMRFAPSIMFLVVLLITLLGKRKQDFSYQSLYFPIFAGIYIGALWSAEALLYALSITGFVLLGLLAIWIGEKGFSLSVFLKRISWFFLSILASLLGAWLSAAIYTLLKVGAFPDLQMHIMFASKYSQGFGSVPLQIANPAWIIGLVITLALFVLLKSTRIEDNQSVTISISALVGGLTGWLTYYLGRAVPDNLIAEYPLIVFCLLTLLYISYQLLGIGKDTKVLKLSTWAIAATFIGIILASTVSQPRFIGTVLSIESLNKPVATSTVQANAKMVDLLSDIPVNSRESLVFEGWAGVLPGLPDDLKSRLESNKVWLPSPLGLLEDPIPPEIRSQTLNRFVDRNLSSGYLVSANKESFPERHIQLLSILTTKYECKTVGSNDEYTLDFCRIKS
jgi:hypothetical protein